MKTTMKTTTTKKKKKKVPPYRNASFEPSNSRTCCGVIARGRREEREREREASAPRGREWWVAFWIFQKTNERTNERTNGADEKRKRRRKTPVWYLNVQIVARGNDASFGASDFRHRAWSDRDRRRHLQKVFLVVVVFEEQSLSLSLSLSLSDWNEERRRCSKEGVLFFKKYNPKLLSAEKKRVVF